MSFKLDLPLEKLAGLIDVAGRAVIVLALLGLILQVGAYFSGTPMAGLVAGTYIMGFALMGLVLMALGKLILVVLDIQQKLNSD